MMKMSFSGLSTRRRSSIITLFTKIRPARTACPPPAPIDRPEEYGQADRLQEDRLLS
jgi:hypothetical protein